MQVCASRSQLIFSGDLSTPLVAAGDAVNPADQIYLNSAKNRVVTVTLYYTHSLPAVMMSRYPLISQARRGN